MTRRGGTLRGPSLRAAAAMVLAACGGAMLVGPRASADSIDFNAGATDLTNNFSVDFDGASANNFNWSSVAGAGGSGGLNTTNTDATAVYVGPNHATTDTAWKLTSGASVSAMFLVPTATAANRSVQVGFINKFKSSFNNDGTNGAVNAAQQALSHQTAFVSVRVYGSGQVEQQVKIGNTETANNSTLFAGDPFLPIIDNVWYKLTLTATETAPGAFTLVSTLDNYGGDGSHFVSNYFTSTPQTVTGVNGFDNSTNDLGIGNALAAVRQIADNPQIDNFVVTGTAVQAPVPEPASLGLLALGGAGLVARRRIRRREIGR